MKKIMSAHFGERDAEIDMLVLHCVAFDAAEALRLFDELKVSSHYILAEDGSLIQCVDESKCAWHAGAGFWRGSEKSVNARSIGIEIVSPSLGQAPYAEAQIAKLIPFCQKIIRKYHILPYNVVGHSDVAPLRKCDPGPAFPWKQLAKEGIGLWYQPRYADKVVSNDIAELLAGIGYDTRSPEAVSASAYAFCRHYLPQYVQRDADVGHLLANVLPADFSFMKEPKFLRVLKAVAYASAKASSAPCKI